MISGPEIEAWRQASPLALAAHMAERDMLLRRLLIEVGNDNVLSQVVVCAGGTTLHQVLLPQPGRYSEDLDLWLAAEVDVYKPICDRWHEIAERLGATAKINMRRKYAQFRLHVPSETADRLMVKVELGRSDQHLAAAATAQRRLVTMSSGWFSGTAEVPCVDPVTLAASKISAIHGRNKPRDLSDLLDLKNILKVPDEEVARRFYDVFRISQWTTGKARQVVSKFHKQPKFLKTLQQESDNGFISDAFDLQQADDAYLAIVDAADQIHAARRAQARTQGRQQHHKTPPGQGTPQRRAPSTGALSTENLRTQVPEPQRCGKTVNATNKPCLLTPKHGGRCRSVLRRSDN